MCLKRECATDRNGGGRHQVLGRRAHSDGLELMDGGGYSREGVLGRRGGVAPVVPADGPPHPCLLVGRPLGRHPEPQLRRRGLLFKRCRARLRRRRALDAGPGLRVAGVRVVAAGVGAVRGRGRLRAGHGGRCASGASGECGRDGGRSRKAAAALCLLLVATSGTLSARSRNGVPPQNAFGTLVTCPKNAQEVMSALPGRAHVRLNPQVLLHCWRRRAVGARPGSGPAEARGRHVRLSGHVGCQG